MSHYQHERKGKHHEETPAHRLCHLCPVPVSVRLTCRNEYPFQQFGFSLHTDCHCKRAERLPGFARSASSTESGIPRSKRSAHRGSGWEKHATSRSSRKNAHQTASVHRPGANAAESLLVHRWAAQQPGPPSHSMSLSGSRQTLALIPRGSPSFRKKAGIVALAKAERNHEWSEPARGIRLPCVKGFSFLTVNTARRRNGTL